MSHKLSCTCGLEGRGGLPPPVQSSAFQEWEVGEWDPYLGGGKGKFFAVPEAGLGSEQSAS